MILKRIQRPWEYKKPKQDNHNKFYDSTEWRKIRAYKLDNNPFCEVCHKLDKFVKANTVDHFRPVRLYEHLKYDINNLTSMCASCHSKNTAIDTKIDTVSDFELNIKQFDLFRGGGYDKCF